MTARNPQTSKPASQTAGNSKLYLNANTPCGLFESMRGSRYIVTESDIDDRPCKVAVAIKSATLPKFLAHVLSEQTLDRGRWLGAYRVRLTHHQPGDRGPTPGLLFLGEHYLYIGSKLGKSRVEWICLGDVGKKGLKVCDFYDDPWCDFSGWTIETATTPKPFASQAPSGEPTWTLDVKVIEAPPVQMG